MQDQEHSEPLVTLTIQGRPVTLLGTAHVSRQSAEAVTRLLDSGDYDQVAIELCESRHTQIQDPDHLARMDLFRVVREGKAAMVLASLALGAFQQRLAEQFGIDPGAEMRAAMRASDQHQLPLHVVDREIGVTLKRVYRSVPWWKRSTIFAGLVASAITREKIEEADIERLKQGDVLESTFQEFSEQSQEIYQPLIAERDRYMALNLFNIAREQTPRHLLAVVGAGHLKGLAEHLQALDRAEPEPSAITRELADLNQLPPPGLFVRLLPWLILLLIAGGFVIGFTRGPEIGWQLVFDWVVITGGLAALGTVIAAGHPLTIAAAFLGAPLTTLHPAIGIGMLTGLVELLVRRPVVADFGHLRHDTAHWSGWWKNRVSRVLLVFVLSSIGAATGTYIAGFRIFDQLFG
ncbi:MAG: TraB/GumN family protein [Thiotrichales bacterium]